MREDDVVAARLRSVLAATDPAVRDGAATADPRRARPPAPGLADLAAAGGPLRWSDVVPAWPDDIDLDPLPTTPVAAGVEALPAPPEADRTGGFPAGTPWASPPAPRSGASALDDPSDPFPTHLGDLMNEAEPFRAPGARPSATGGDTELARAFGAFGPPGSAGRPELTGAFGRSRSAPSGGDPELSGAFGGFRSAVPGGDPESTGAFGVSRSAVPGGGAELTGGFGGLRAAAMGGDPELTGAFGGGGPAATGEPGLTGAGAFGGGRLAAFDPGRRGVRALAVVAVLVLVVAAVLAWRARPRVEPVAPPSFATTVAAADDPVRRAATGSAGAEVVVAVGGKVRKPGLVHLPAGARVADALTAAGGADPGVDVEPLNLARKVVDGELIMVGVTPPPGVPAPAGANAAPGGPVNLNTATLADLDGLPGVGPVLAQRILDARDAQGGFTAVSDLRKVDGIGDARFEQLKDLVTV